MKIVLDDTFTKAHLYPFAVVKTPVDIRIGILTIREKWERILGYSITSSNDLPEILSIKLSSNIVPTKKWVDTILKNGVVEKNVGSEDNVRVLKHAKDIFINNDWALRNDFELITKGRKSQPISSTNKVIAVENIFIEEGASVEYSILNASTGPIYIGKNAMVMEGCMIRGSLALCEGAVLKMGAKIYGATTIGPYCTVGGEVKNSVLFGYSNKAHDGYLGDSVIGEWCNLGAGVSCSNVKNTASDVMVWNEVEGNNITAGLKCGLLMGNYSKAAINTSFNTGTVVGIGCNVFGEGFMPKHIKNFTWGVDRYRLDDFLRDVNNWKKLKGQNITQQEKEIITSLYNQ